ncbi:MAG: endoglucanase [Verrucomicrobiota bacterium]|jgi:hypothetical protein
MKTPFLITLCLTISVLALKADELLKNPSFETEGKSSDTAADWSRWGDWVNRETGWTPTHSGKCLVGYHHWQINKGDNSGIWQDVSGVKAGQRFSFSVFVCADAPNKGDNPAEKIELRLEATRGGQQVQIQAVSVPISDLKDSGWHKLTVSGTTPEDNLRVLVAVTPAANSPRGGAIKIDDAALEVSN